MCDIKEEQMLEGGVKESRVVVWRRRTILIRVPVTLQDRRPVVDETCDVIALERNLGVSALCERQEPKHSKHANICDMVFTWKPCYEEINYHHLLSFMFLVCLSSSKGRTMPLSLSSS